MTVVGARVGCQALRCCSLNQLATRYGAFRGAHIYKYFFERVLSESIFSPDLPPESSYTCDAWSSDGMGAIIRVGSPEY